MSGVLTQMTASASLGVLVIDAYASELGDAGFVPFNLPVSGPYRPLGRSSILGFGLGRRMWWLPNSPSVQ